MEEDAREVERLYSTKPIRVVLGPREYVIPVNHFTEKGADRPETFVAQGWFGFVLFLPAYGGFTKENWQKGWFHPNRIDVLDVRNVDKTALVPHIDGGMRKIEPASFGEPKAQFETARLLFEETPSINAYGLEGYRRKNRQPGVLWVGHRWNGEFFFSGPPPHQASPCHPAWSMGSVMFVTTARPRISVSHTAIGCNTSRVGKR